MHTLIAELTPGAFAILAVVGVMTCMLLVRTQKQLKSTGGSHAKAGGQHAGRQRAKEETQATRQIEQWEVRMHEVARELSAQLDSKIVAVELLVREAQEQIARWQRLTAAGQPSAPPQGDNIPNELAPAAHVGTQAAALARSSSPRPHVLARSSSRRHQEVYALSDAGQSSAAIAAQLGSPIGEVELILGLRRDQPQ
ncbi:MAG TPA: hypothetical protein VIK18_18105 [Pirellulales bacterium]